MFSTSFIATAAAFSFIAPTSALYDASSSANLAMYWGSGSNQNELGYFCNQSTVDIIPIGFVNYFPQQTSGGLPGANFGNACWGDPSYPGSDGHLYERCVNLQQDIPACQKAGKRIVLSLGGGSSTYQLTGAAAGTAFATQLWQMYGPYNATYVAAGGIRPLDGGYYNDKNDPNYWIDIDGFDFDIEIKSTDHALGYIAMIKQLRALFATNPCKKYLITGSPQCVVPDANMDDIIQAVAFDALWIQFYNTPACSARTWVSGNSALNTTSGKNTASGFTYDNWVIQTAAGASKNAKLYIGLLGGPAGTTALHSNDFLWPTEAINLIKTYVSHARFGGVMVYEATVADNQRVKYNGALVNYYNFIKSVLRPYAPSTPAPMPPLCPSSTSSSSSATRTSTTAQTTSSSTKTSTTTQSTSKSLSSTSTTKSSSISSTRSSSSTTKASSSTSTTKSSSISSTRSSSSTTKASSSTSTSKASTTSSKPSTSSSSKPTTTTSKPSSSLTGSTSSSQTSSKSSSSSVSKIPSVVFSSQTTSQVSSSKPSSSSVLQTSSAVLSSSSSSSSVSQTSSVIPSSSSSSSTSGGVSATSSSSSQSSVVTTESSSATASPSGIQSSCKSEGCWTEGNGVRALGAMSYVDYDLMSEEICYDFCVTQHGYSVFGLEYGGECWCGDTLDSSSQVAVASDCSMPCGGTPNETCGAGNRLTVFSCGPASSQPTSSSASGISQSSTSQSGSATTTSSQSSLESSSSLSSSSTASSSSVVSSTGTSQSSTSQSGSATTTSSQSSLESSSSLSSSSTASSSSVISSTGTSQSITSQSGSATTASSQSSLESSSSLSSSSTASSSSVGSSTGTSLSSSSSSSIVSSSSASSSSGASSSTGSSTYGVSSSSAYPSSSSSNSVSSTSSVGSSSSLVAYPTYPTGSSSSEYSSSSTPVPTSSESSSYIVSPSPSGSVSSGYPSGTIIPPYQNTSTPIYPTYPTGSESGSSSSASSSGPESTPIYPTYPAGDKPTSTYGGDADQTTSYTTSTAYSTSVYTITSCAPTVTDCPGRLGQETTEVITLYTTVCPVTETESSKGETKPTYTPVGPPASYTPYTPYTTSTVYTTNIYTITSCAATVTDCPGRIGQVTTEVVSLYTTVCPVTEDTPTPSAPAGYPTSTAGGDEFSTTTVSSTKTVYRTVVPAPSTATVIPVPFTATVVPIPPYPTGSASSYPVGTGTGSVATIQPSGTTGGYTPGVETHTPSPSVFTGSGSKMGGSLMAVLLATAVAMFV